MKLNRLTDYAVLVLWRLSEPPRSGEARDAVGRRMLAAPGLSEETVVPLPTVSKVLKLMSKAGLLVSARGVHGGYSLAKAPQDISVADIISAIEGPVSLTACVDDGETVCEHTALCGMSGNWDRVNTAVLEVLNSISLVEMIPQPISFFAPDMVAPGPSGAATSSSLKTP